MLSHVSKETCVLLARYGTCHARVTWCHPWTGSYVKTKYLRDVCCVPAWLMLRVVIYELLIDWSFIGPHAGRSVAVMWYRLWRNLEPMLVHVRALKLIVRLHVRNVLCWPDTAALVHPCFYLPLAGRKPQAKNTNCQLGKNAYRQGNTFCQPSARWPVMCM